MTPDTNVFNKQVVSKWAIKFQI